MAIFTLVRCPECGSTNAGEDGGAYEFTLMRCGSCGHSEYCDHYEIVGSWNVDVDIAAGATAIPERLPPLHARTADDIPGACEECRNAAERQSLRPGSARQEQFAIVEGLRGDIRRCKRCILCYRHERVPSFSIDGEEDVYTRIDPATSIALLGLASGDLTAEWLAALAAAPGFTKDIVDEARLTGKASRDPPTSRGT